MANIFFPVKFIYFSTNLMFLFFVGDFPLELLLHSSEALPVNLIYKQSVDAFKEFLCHTTGEKNLLLWMMLQRSKHFTEEEKYKWGKPTFYDCELLYTSFFMKVRPKYSFVNFVALYYGSPRCSQTKQKVDNKIKSWQQNKKSTTR